MGSQFHLHFSHQSITAWTRNHNLPKFKRLFDNPIVYLLSKFHTHTHTHILSYRVILQLTKKRTDIQTNSGENSTPPKSGGGNCRSTAYRVWISGCRSWEVVPADASCTRASAAWPAEIRYRTRPVLRHRSISSPPPETVATDKYATIHDTRYDKKRLARAKKLSTAIDQSGIERVQACTR